MPHACTHLNGVSQSPKSCPFHVTTSRTWRIPLSRQLSSKIQSKTVCGGRVEGKGFMRGLPSTRERIVVFGTVGTSVHQGRALGFSIGCTHLYQQSQTSDVSLQDIVFPSVQALPRPIQSRGRPECHRADLQTHRSRPSSLAILHTCTCLPTCLPSHFSCYLAMTIHEPRSRAEAARGPCPSASSFSAPVSAC